MHFQLFWWRSWVRLPAGNASTFRNLVPEGQTALGGPLGVPFPVGIQPGSGKKIYIYNYILYIYILVYIFISPSITGSFPLASLDYQRGISRIVAPFHRCSYSYLTVHEILIPWFLTDVGLNLQGWLQ